MKLAVRSGQHLWCCQKSKSVRLRCWLLLTAYIHMAWRSLLHSRLHDSEAAVDGDVVCDGNDPSYSEDTVAYTLGV